MQRTRRALAVALGCAAATAGAAAETDFTGIYAGPEIGAIEHHFYLDISDSTGRLVSSRYYRKTGIGGGLFAGRDWRIIDRFRVGGEVSLSFGGDNPVARFPDGRYFTEQPRYGIKGVVRGGFVAAPRLLLYASGGYGAHRYRLAGTTVAGAHDWGSSFVIGGGAEYRVTDRIGLRFDFKHLDNQTSHFLIGVPIRF